MRQLKEKAEGNPDDYDSAPKYAAPEIRIDKDYFAKAGLDYEGDLDQPNSDTEEETGISSEDLDAEYFKWQQEESGEEEKKSGKKGLGGLFGLKH